MSHRSNYMAIWIWLLALMTLSVAASALPVGRSAVILVLFGVAVVKAVLVVRNYMHLRSESWLLYTIALVPVAFVIGLIIALFPDFVFRH